MKLRRIYSNDPDLFGPIEFRDGLNVVVAHVTKPADSSKDTHNLGKSLLIDVIDFCLLKGIDKDHFLKSRPDLFGHLVLFLEIQTPSGEFVTIRRGAEAATKISLKKYSESGQDMSALTEPSAWDHWLIPLTRAVDCLDGWLGMTVLRPDNYRSGLTYFLRRQGDYNDVFRVEKYRGEDSQWKPTVARLIGMNGELIRKKYETDSEVAHIKDRIQDLEREAGKKPSDLPMIQAKITVLADELARQMSALDEFDFLPSEHGLIEELADTIEVEIADVATRLYNNRHDLAHIQRGLDTKVAFDLSAVRRVYEEAEISFPGQLERDYSALIDFNRRMLQERRQALARLATDLTSGIIDLEARLTNLSARRHEVLQVLGGSDSLKKFKDLQHDLDEKRGELALLTNQADRVKRILEYEESGKAAKARRSILADEIHLMVDHGSQRYQEIQITFNRLVKELVQRNAILFAQKNGDDNVDFRALYSDSDDSVTQEDRGTSFKQILCIAFDLALLMCHSDESFFRFVYHDGALERFERRRRMALVETIRRTCANYPVQYILTALEEDIPTSDGQPAIRPDDVILELNDEGPAGRLFHCEVF